MQYRKIQIGTSNQWRIQGTIGKVLEPKTEIVDGKISRLNRFRLDGYPKIYHSLDGAVEFIEGVEIEGILHHNGRIDISHYKPLN